jgi:hypothetical protein
MIIWGRWGKEFFGEEKMKITFWKRMNSPHHTKI